MRTNRKKHQTPALNLIIAIGLVTASGIGLGITSANPEEHPFIFALCLSWLVTLFTSALTTKPFFAMPPSRFRVAAWERNGKIYKRLGVDTFRWMLLHTPLGWVNPNYGQIQSKADLDRLMRQLNCAEGAHLVAGGITLAVTAVFALRGQPSIGVWLVLISIPLHAYPIMLQRWNRARIVRIAQRVASRTKESNLL
ncbi:MAG: hypothetical protein ACOY0R_21400 [Chloroflexota bacterium]